MLTSFVSVVFDIIHINRLTLTEKSPLTQSFMLTYQYEFKSLFFGGIFFFSTIHIAVQAHI